MLDEGDGVPDRHSNESTSPHTPCWSERCPILALSDRWTLPELRARAARCAEEPDEKQRLTVLHRPRSTHVTG